MPCKLPGNSPPVKPHFQFKVFVVVYRGCKGGDMSKLTVCCLTSCEFDEKRATKPKFSAQRSPALYFSQQTRNECFCRATY